jgi:hypothetical protein
VKPKDQGLLVRSLSGLDRLAARLEAIVISDESFLYYARQWRELRKHRAQLRDMASRYPVIIDFWDVRVVLESPEDVDRLTANIRAKLKERWTL